WTPVAVTAGQVLEVGRAEQGCRSYLAVRNGLDVPLYLGSRSTFALGQFGGHAGRTLRAADMLPISNPASAACDTPAPCHAPAPAPAELIPPMAGTGTSACSTAPMAHRISSPRRPSRCSSIPPGKCITTPTASAFG